MANKQNVLDLTDAKVVDEPTETTSNGSVQGSTQISQDDLGALRAIRTRYSELVNKLGQVSIEKVRLQTLQNTVKKAEDEAIEEYNRLVQQEQDTFNALSERYGQGNLDLETGKFTPAK